jgi:hypothetical protein
MQASSASYVAFDATTNQNIINVDSANNIPGTIGNASYQFSNNELQLSSSLYENTRKSVCLNPSMIIAGVQTFVAFAIPASLTTGTAVEVWFSESSGKIFSSSIKSLSSGYVFELDISGVKDSTPVTLSTGTVYVLLVHVDSSGAYTTAQIVDKVCMTF